MPAFGLTGRLSDGEIRSVVQYVLQLSGDNYDPTAANEGRRVFYGNANCSDCHGMDARGDSGYGAPDLTAQRVEQRQQRAGSIPGDLFRRAPCHAGMARSPAPGADSRAGRVRVLGIASNTGAGRQHLRAILITPGGAARRDDHGYT